MLKFMVVLYKRSDLTREQFRAHLENVHAPLAKSLSGLKIHPESSRTGSQTPRACMGCHRRTLFR